MQQLDYSVLLNKTSAADQISQGIMQGVQIQAYQDAAAAKKQEAEQMAAQQARQQEFMGKLSAAKGDEKAALAAQYPEYLEQIKGVLGFENEVQAKAFGELGITLSQLAESDPQAAAQVIEQNADILRTKGAGFEPEALMELLQTNPAELAKRADTIGLAGLGVKDYQAVMAKRGDQALTASGQAVTMRGQYMTAANASADRQQRAASAAQKANATLQAAAIKAGSETGLSAKDLVQINKDLTKFNAEHGVMYDAAQSLQTIKENASPAAQVAAIFKFMKALDPTSVVREGEQVMVSRTDGVFGQLGNALNSALNGKKLNADQLADLQKTAALLANSQAQTVDQQISDYLGTYGETIPENQKKLLEKRRPRKLDIAGEQPVRTSGGASGSFGGAKFLGFE